ncbi:uncharacterized protein LOC113389159 isoform X2 [Ctenocephalides felis]|uniref:uncharacterized protein LOC113389159 isoform X2 n=1 Tax=Ctenocephalides felis TaxID=7515 RepID=UPI000E6E27DE|nr:uncharacterized protein LOC113389159 isoform X2 [Ctenocephalides felis]
MEENSTEQNVKIEIAKNLIKPRYYKQLYRTAWEDIPEFKGWLKGIPGQGSRAYCTFCQKSLHAHRLSLLKHTCTIRHQKAAQLNFMSQKHMGPSSTISNQESPLLQEVTLQIPNNLDSIYADEDDNLEPEFIENEEEEDCQDVPHYVLKAADAAAAAASAQKPPISTHVLDTAKGKAVGGLQVSLYKLVDGRWTFINEGMTNPDGRCADLMERSNFTAGRYKLHFDVDKFFELRKQETLYPFIEIVFDCRAPQEHYHIPLLLSPFGYTTYRGT